MLRICIDEHSVNRLNTVYSLHTSSESSQHGRMTFGIVTVYTDTQIKYSSLTA